MNIYKKGQLRNLTNEELEILLKKYEWSDKDLLREYEERFQMGRINFKPGMIEEYFRLINFVTRFPDKSK